MTHSLRLALAASAALGFAAGPALSQAQETAILAGGCFWCVEADFEKMAGVAEVYSGFTGGTVANPSYEQVTDGGTGHYEAARIIYDPAKVSYDQLMYAFFRSVNPTDPGGQFCDRGDSYRTAIFVRTTSLCCRRWSTASCCACVRNLCPQINHERTVHGAWCQQHACHVGAAVAPQRTRA